MAQGGDRRPENPAPVGMPGAMSRRTDGGPADPQPERRLPDAKYGENKAFQAAESAAPMAGGGNAAPSAPPGVVPLDADTQRPTEDVMASPPDLAMMPEPETLDQADAMALKSLMPGLELLASMPDSTPSFRVIYRRLRAAQAGLPQ